jgi:hypothetical protein
MIVLWPERGPALVTGDESPSHVLDVVLLFVAVPMLFVAGLGAVISLFVRFRRARGGWAPAAQVVRLRRPYACLDNCVRAVFPRVLPEAIVALSFLLVVPSIPIATGIAILRYRLYDIDLLINRTLVYGSLTVMLALVYFGGVATTQAIFRVLSGQQEQPQLAVVVSTLVIAGLFMPLRRRIQSFIDRRFYRRKYDARKTLERVMNSIRNGLGMRETEIAREPSWPW